MEQLRADAALYAKVTNPKEWHCADFEKEVRNSLSALIAFGVSQPRPVLLALLRSYRDGKIKYVRVRKTITAIENFHYLTTAIAGMSSTGGTSEMYAKHARELTAATSSPARADTLDRLVAKLTDSQRLPTREAFLSEFPRVLRFSETESSAKRLVQYTLQKIHDFSVSGTALDHARCNIEHISPQQDDEAWMPEIGNLLWVDKDLNNRLGTKTFTAKREILKERSGVYDFRGVIDAEDWIREDVALRSKRLAELAYDNVWAGRA